MKNTKTLYGLTFVLALSLVGQMQAQQSSLRSIKLLVDATHAAQKFLHAELTIPASRGPLTLYYPKWMPADHSPDGPIANLTGLKFFAGNKPIPWRRNLVDMYTFHLNVPEGTESVDVQLDFLLSAPGPTIDFSASSSAKLLILMWNQILLYPAGWPANKLTYDPILRLPAGWKFSTSLPVRGRSGDTVTFNPVTLDLLVDSPVQSGQFMKVISLRPNEKPPHEIDVAADHPWALEIPSSLIESYNRLIDEAGALYQSHHYRDYHFLLTLSDNVLRLGQEHHESSDNRMPERTLLDPNTRLFEAGLFPHEFTHSWNGQFRRPEGLATQDFQQPMKGDLLWVYEGLTSYLGTVLTVRSGLWTPVQARENLALVASTLEHRVGRGWRSLQDTADAAQVLYFAPAEWSSYRRETDFYAESVLLWLEVDVIMRKLTQDHRSMNDFCRLFFGGPDGAPVVKTFTLTDVISTLNGIASYDWRTFLRERLDSTASRAPLGGIAGGGWRLAYNDEPNEMLVAGQAASGTGDFTSSLGLVVKSDGRIQDAIPGMPAYTTGLSPYMRILGVNGQQFSLEELARAVRDSKSNSNSITILVSNTGSLEVHEIQYHGGSRYPHLERSQGAADYLGKILKPLLESRSSLHDEQLPKHHGKTLR